METEKISRNAIWGGVGLESHGWSSAWVIQGQRPAYVDVRNTFLYFALRTPNKHGGPRNSITEPVFVGRSRGLHGKFTSLGSKTGIRFDTKWHHNWPNQLFSARISIQIPVRVFLDFRFSIFLKIFSKNMFVRYRGKNNEGVLERPGTKWKVLKAISSTLKCQFSGKCRKVDFSMPCKTKSAENLHVWPYAPCGRPGNPKTSPI